MSRQYAEKCMTCKKDCKQNVGSTVIKCPDYEYKMPKNDGAEQTLAKPYWVPQKKKDKMLSRRKKRQRSIAEQFKGKL